MLFRLTIFLVIIDSHPDHEEIRPQRSSLPCVCGCLLFRIYRVRLDRARALSYQGTYALFCSELRYICTFIVLKWRYLLFRIHRVWLDRARALSYQGINLHLSIICLLALIKVIFDYAKTYCGTRIWNQRGI